MSDTTRWCFTCQHRPLSDGLGMEWVIDSGCVGKGHDVADALVIRAPINYEALRERVCRRIHAVGPASLNASQVTQLKLAMDDIRAALGDSDE